MQNTSCPSVDELSEMLAGRLSVERSERLMDHVDGCQGCQSRVGSLPPDDPLAEQLSVLSDFEANETDRDAQRLPISSHSANASQNRLLELPATIGSYVLVRLIARGGMSTVYEARHRRLGKSFAFKLLHSGTAMTRAQADRVRREWRAHGSLIHPNIVGATDAGIVHGQPYLVTERINGFDLSQLIKKRGPLQPAVACELVRQAAVGLQYAHENGVIHRDIKPSNLMLDSVARLRVLDLGTAQWQGDALDDSTQRDATVSLHGTLAYMAPEQFDRPLSANERTDVYSLGCTLYFILCGKEPFGSPKDRSNGEVIDAHRRETASLLQESVPDETTIPPALQTVVERMLAKQPSDRFGSMEDVAESLAPFSNADELSVLASELQLEPPLCDDEPLGTRGLTSLLSVPARQRRHGLIATLLVVCLLMLGWWAMHSSRRPPARIGETRDDVSPLAGSIESIGMVHDSPIERLSSRGGRVWTAVPRTGSLDGIVLQPAVLSGIGAWQIETVAPRGRLRDIDWSDDGRSLAVTSGDGHLRVYRWHDRRLQLIWILAIRGKRFTLVDWHPSEPLIACASDSGVCVVDARTRQIAHETKQYTSVRQIEWHPDGQRIGIATPAGVLVLDESHLKQQCATPRKDVWDFAWSPSGEQIIATSLMSVATLSYRDGGFDAGPNTMTRFKRQDACYRVAWHSDGRSVALMRLRSLDRCNAETLDVKQATKIPMLASMSIRRSDSAVAVGFQRSAAVVTDGQIVDDRPYAAQHGGRPQVAWHPSGQFLAVGINGIVSIVDPTMKEIEQIGGNNHITGVQGFGQGSVCVMTQNGKTAVFARDGSIRGSANVSSGSIRTIASFALLEQSERLFIYPVVGAHFEIEIPGTIPPAELAIDPDTADTFSCIEGDILTYDPAQQAWLTLMRNPGNTPEIAVSPDHTQLACLDTRGVIKMVSVAEQRVTSTWQLSNIDGANTICWHPGVNRLLVTCSQNDVAHVVCLDPTSGQEQWRLREPGFGRAIRAVPTGATTFLHSGDPFKERNAATGDVTRTIDVTSNSDLRHQLLHRASGSDQIQSWSRYTLDHVSNASDPVVCWDNGSLRPTHCLLGVGETGWVSLTPAGQIIDATPGALDKLVWIVETSTGREYLSYDAFDRKE